MPPAPKERAHTGAHRASRRTHTHAHANTHAHTRRHAHQHTHKHTRDARKGTPTHKQPPRHRPATDSAHMHTSTHADNTSAQSATQQKCWVGFPLLAAIPCHYHVEFDKAPDWTSVEKMRFACSLPNASPMHGRGSKDSLRTIKNQGERGPQTNDA